MPTIFFFKPPAIPKRKAPRKRTFATSEACNLTPETFGKFLNEKIRYVNYIYIYFCIFLGGIPQEPMQIIFPQEQEAAPAISYTVRSSTSSEDSEQHSRHSDILQTNPDKDLLAKLEKYEKIYIKEKKKANNYKRLLRNTKKTLANRSEAFRVEEYPLLKQMFNDDQINALKKKRQKTSTKLMRWSNQTITKSLKLKFSCGVMGTVNY